MHSCSSCASVVSNVMRQNASAVFRSYVDAYASDDVRIAFKIEHSYEVAKLCDEISRTEGWPDEDVGLAWLCGLFHDIGRFEQLRKWGTFNDAVSCSHAKMGLKVLRELICILPLKRGLGVNSW